MQCCGTCGTRSCNRVRRSRVGQLSNLPNNGPSDITVNDCLQAVDSLIRRGLLIELSNSDIDADLARWRSESLPVSWGVDRDRYPGDVDLTETGFRLTVAITQQEFPDLKRSSMTGYNNETPGLIRVFGESEESCERQLKSVVDRIDKTPWRWPRESFQSEPMRPLGPWWYSRFERVPTGFEIVVRRTIARLPNVGLVSTGTDFNEEFLPVPWSTGLISRAA
jgi:hypothetical protein